MRELSKSKISEGAADAAARARRRGVDSQWQMTAATVKGSKDKAHHQRQGEIVR
jgi:hypothetical protein